MPIDFSTHSADWWRVSFEKYITGGGNLETIIEGGSVGIRRHFDACLPKDSFTDTNLQKVGNVWVLECTHPAGGPFRITMNQVTKEWSFEWL